MQHSRAAAAPTESAKKMIAVDAGGCVLAMPVFDVVEVLRAPAVRPIPRCRPHLLGYIKWREELLPVLDVQELWHPGREAESARRERPMAVVVSARDRRFAIACERTLGIGFPEGTMVAARDEGERAYVVGKTRILGCRDAIVLDLAAFWNDEIEGNGQFDV